MRILVLVMLVFVAFAAPAVAQEPPKTAAAADWVVRVDIPEPKPELKDRPLQPLLVTSQSRSLTGQQREQYFEFATLVQNPQGLSALGTIAIPWQPDHAELVVHKVHLIRGGEVVDVLGAGQSFTVLRRENNLEAAMLDGVLTAVLQPEGLAVGDVVNVAWTLRSKAGTLDYKPESFYTIVHGLPIRRVHFRELWSAGMPIQWKASEAIGRPKVRTRDGVTELLLDLEDAEGPKPPENAPTRYMLPAWLEVSGYPDWNAVAKLMAPHYATAAQLAPDSPLKAEIARIAASTDDPKARAMAALRLVQDRVRYLALSMGDGGHVPASADQTWARKYGDCKGKTAMLLALLSGLGIEAEAVAVHSALGDTVDRYLPRVQLFDHVLVRARIDGRSYWLDGTRTGDRDLEDLASAPFRWGLPLTQTAAALERIPLLPPRLPLTETTIHYDASAGLTAPAPVEGTIVFRGDLATALRAALSQAPKEELRDAMYQFHAGMPAAEDITEFDMKADERTGEVIARFKGTTLVAWERAPNSPALRYAFEDDTTQWEPEFKRDDGPQKDAPFTLRFPVYLSSTETIVLPGGGKGFTLEAEPLDETVAGTEIRRTVALEQGRVVARSSFRKLQAELPADEARAAVAKLQSLNARKAWIIAPADYVVTDEERKAVLSSQPVTASGYGQRGYELMQDFRVKEALADFEKAVELSPDWSTAHANRGLALFHLRRFDEAKGALDRAAALDEDDDVVWHGRALLALHAGRSNEALAAAERALLLDHASSFSASLKRSALLQLGRFDEAEASFAKSIEEEPDGTRFLLDLARLQAWRGRYDEALANVRKAEEAEERPERLAAFKGYLLTRAGRSEEAQAAYRIALAGIDKDIAAATGDMKRELRRGRAQILAQMGETAQAIKLDGELIREAPDNAILLNSRCWHRATANVELEAALEDCDRGLEIAPQIAAIADSRGLVKLRLGRLDEAIADYDKAIELNPGNAHSWYGRGVARLRKGDKEGAEADFAEARRRSYDIAAEFERYGLSAAQPAP